MNPSTIQTQLAAWVTAITASQIGAGDGLPAYWQRAPAGRRGTHALLWLGPIVGVGGDDLDYEVDLLADPGEEITHYQMGQRQFTLQVQIWSYSSNPSKNAREYVRRIRDRLWLDDWDSMLATAEIGVQGVNPEIDLSGNIGHGRETSAAQLDIVFNACTNEAGAAIGYIATVEFETNFTLPDGSPASGQFSGDIEVG